MNNLNSESKDVAEAWRGYQQSIEELRSTLYQSEIREFTNELALNMYVLQLQAFAYHSVIAPQQQRPVILGSTFFSAQGFRLGMQSPNFLYRAIYLDGRHSFRLRGQRGNSLFHQIIVMQGGYNDPNPVLIGDYQIDDFLDENGHFDIRVGAEESSNGIVIKESSRNNWVFMRECIQSWDVAEKTDVMDIEPVENIMSLVKFDDDQEAVDRINGAQRLIKVLHATAGWPHFKKNNFDVTGPNEFSPLIHPGAAAYNPAAHYLYALYELKDDEVLLLEADCSHGFKFWDICSCDVLGQNTDFIYRQSSLTNHQACVDADNKVRIIVSPEDPGIANWVDTDQKKVGTLMWRWYWADKAIQHTCDVIKKSEISARLPKQTKNFSSSQREQSLRERRFSFTKRYGGLL